MREIKNNVFRAENTSVAETDVNTGKVFTKTRASYVAAGEKTALIGGAADTVPDSVISSADYAVFPSALPALGINRILSLNPNIEVIASTAGIRNLKEIVNSAFNERIAKEGAELPLGGKTLKFLTAANLFSPDTIFVYDKEDKILFSGNAFGSYDILDGFAELYENELERYKPFVRTASERALSLDVDAVCPSVGAVTNAEAIKEYVKWSAPASNTVKSAAIFYVSSSGNTEVMAKCAERVMAERGFDVKRFDALKCGKAEMLGAFYGAGALAFGVPTIHRNAPKPIWDIITSADLVNMKYKPCMVFGSHGWGGEGADLIYNCLKIMRVRPFEKPFKCIFTPSAEDLKEFEKYIRKFTESINEI